MDETCALRATLTGHCPERKILDSIVENESLKKEHGYLKTLESIAELENLVKKII